MKRTGSFSLKSFSLESPDRFSPRPYSSQFYANEPLLNRIAERAHYLSNQMIFEANNRDNKEKGDPKVGGHSSATSSALHIMGALHLLVRTGFDFLVNKPHASPVDHAYHYLLNLFFDKEFSRLSEAESSQALFQLRAFPTSESPYVFQSYHSAHDPDCYHFLPSGTVGIPPVNLGYLAHAYAFAKKQGYDVPPSHFWALMGDSEFREGSLFEAAVDFSEREIGNLTWIVDYNRQSLDGHRMSNPHIMGGTDAHRIEKTMEANGWKIIQVQHGRKREAFFKTKKGKIFQNFLENQLTDYELQTLLLMKKDQIRIFLKEHHSLFFKNALNSVSDDKLYEIFHDLGGHDLLLLAQTFKNLRDEDQKKLKSGSRRQPSLVIAHTLKGWGLHMAALAGNHSFLPGAKEMSVLRQKTGLKKEESFSLFSKNSEEGRFLKKRGDHLYEEMKKQREIVKRNQSLFSKKSLNYLKGLSWDSIEKSGFGVDLKMLSYPHTQWMFGQITSKLTRISNTDLKKLSQFPLEQSWKAESEMLVFMSPDVGTSTNLNPSMDKKVFGSPLSEDMEEKWKVKDVKSPTLLPDLELDHRFLRFEIAEASSMSCLGSYGYLGKALGVPVLPVMTVYDFFIKRALDQYFYNLYWNSSFILVGTPSGVTLSPEGAQHAWKSDFQIPNQIIWEPCYCLELEWILAETIKRHFEQRNQGRSGVLIRCVTRGIDQNSFLKSLRKQARFKAKLSEGTLLSPKAYSLSGAICEANLSPLGDSEILSAIRKDVLEGGYVLIDYSGYQDYEVQENVIHIFAMSSLVTEAEKASYELLKKGLYANVIVVTSPDLLIGVLGEKENYRHLKDILLPLLKSSRERKNSSSERVRGYREGGFREETEVFESTGSVPIVSVHDGEVGLLDNIGSILGVRQKALAVKKHSKSGTPKDIYNYHGIDSQAIQEACQEILG